MHPVFFESQERRHLGQGLVLAVELSLELLDLLRLGRLATPAFLRLAECAESSLLDLLAPLLELGRMDPVTPKELAELVV